MNTENSGGGETRGGAPAETMPHSITYIGMGANLGNARSTLILAAKDIAALSGIHATQLSPLYRSAPVDAGGPDYVNAVLRADTTLEAEELLRALQEIETRRGRQRPYRNAPRTLDLDLLLHGKEERQTRFLTLPHPRMHERAFVLMPLQDLAPELVLTQGSLPGLLAMLGNQRIERLS